MVTRCFVSFMMITDYLEKESGLLEKIKEDKERPKYHFCALCDLGFPFDPNAPFFYNGMYHMFYIYESRNDSYRWAHSISEDLLHWTPLPDALIPDENDGGIYSGGVYLKDDTAYVIYWALGKDGKPDGIRIAKSVDDNFINWQKIDGQIVTNVQEGVANGDTSFICITGFFDECADVKTIDELKDYIVEQLNIENLELKKEYSKNNDINYDI